MNPAIHNERDVAVPAMQMREIIELLVILANGRENASHQSQARVLANSLGNRLRDVEKEANR